MRSTFNFGLSSLTRISSACEACVSYAEACHATANASPSGRALHQPLLRGWKSCAQGMSFVAVHASHLIGPVQVEGVLYKLYSTLVVRQSVAFRELLSILTLDKEEGRSDDKPIELAGISASDFDCLMDYLWMDFS